MGSHINRTFCSYQTFTSLSRSIIKLYGGASYAVTTVVSSTQQAIAAAGSSAWRATKSAVGPKGFREFGHSLSSNGVNQTAIFGLACVNDCTPQEAQQLLVSVPLNFYSYYLGGALVKTNGALVIASTGLYNNSYHSRDLTMAAGSVGSVYFIGSYFF